MNNRIDAIYARQSVDKKDSISIESQIEFCKYELKAGTARSTGIKGIPGKIRSGRSFNSSCGILKAALCGKWWYTNLTVSAVPFSICEDDGLLPKIRCGVCVLYGEV